MKKNLFILCAFILTINVSCNNSDKRNSEQGDSKTKTKADSLMDDIMAGHDASMAKSSKLTLMQSKVQQQIDSIEKLPGKARNESAVFKRGLDSSLIALKSAEGGMNKWMDEFNMDSLENNTDKRIKYLESEKLKVTKVRDDMISSIQKADSLLKKTTKQ